MITVSGCGAPGNGGGTGAPAPRLAALDERRALDRAEEIIRQAVDGMSPRPTPERMGPAPVGACIARDDHRPDDRVQVTVVYKLTGVPAAEAQNLVRQARDAWLEQGHERNTSGEVDWSTPFPAVYLRTRSDDFWMDAVTGVTDRAKGEGLASLKVTSPCFRPTGTASPTAG
ncbi:hypothetical protein [Streptomyces sp. NPDC047014]|uniref:hypothetical protein n=1 Tax=Streptomyces sp. NPDC047014 TaxID=3155736 RepID=UPI0033D7834A